LHQGVSPGVDTPQQLWRTNNLKKISFAQRFSNSRDSPADEINQF